MATTVNVLNDGLTDEIHQNIYQKIASELFIQTQQVVAFAKLYDEGATIPFIARYRKQQTQGLDDNQLRTLEKLLTYERDMASRRLKITELLSNQGKLTDELIQRIANANSKLELEDIYLPYRPRRRSLATQAKEAGLEPIANAILQNQITIEQALASYQVPNTVVEQEQEGDSSHFLDQEKQLAGIMAIIIDEWTQSLDLLDKLRIGFGQIAQIRATLASEDKREIGEKFKDYFDYTENLGKLATHRLLAILRGRKENVLTIQIEGEDEHFIEQIINHFHIKQCLPEERSRFLAKIAKKLWLEKWRPHIEHRLLTEKRLLAESDAIDVFAKNLQHLLMSAPAGQKVILGVDPGYKHGVKLAVVDSLGEVAKNLDGQFATAVVYPFQQANHESQLKYAKAQILQLLTEYQVDLIAIGNGTASRETDALIKQILAENPDLTVTAVVVSEAGASVYSASELAAQELSELDVSLRGAVSIARRLQDPLSELVKVEPKAIGVGQYQHDVNEIQLTDSLNKVTQDCVNAVGVDVNTASPAILAHIAGLNSNVAQQIVNYRNEHGAFSNREQLKNVPRLGVKTFEQAAGFLRIRQGEEPLDATGLHPENYHLVKTWLDETGKTLQQVLGNDTLLQDLDRYLLTNNHEENADIKVMMIKQELSKPAYDPRPAFRTAKFCEHIKSINDLEIGMELEGVVTNVTNFGCFVDVGVHQDGLVHISELDNKFINNPLLHVKPSDIIKVRVISLDVERKRIGFSMKQPQEKYKKLKHHKTPSNKSNAHKNQQSKPRSPINKSQVGSLGALLAQAGLGKNS